MSNTAGGETETGLLARVASDMRDMAARWRRTCRMGPTEPVAFTVPDIVSDDQMDALAVMLAPTVTLQRP